MSLQINKYFFPKEYDLVVLIMAEFVCNLQCRKWLFKDESGEVFVSKY